MKNRTKYVAVLTAATLWTASRPVCADLIDDFNRSDGPVATDSIGTNPFTLAKYSYTERASSPGPDLVNVARIENNKLRIFGNNAGATSLLQAGSPGLVTLTGYNNAYPTVSATVAFDEGSLNTQAATIASSGSLIANRIGFILRAPTNINFNSPSVGASQAGYIDAQIGPNGDILIRELKSNNTLTNVYARNPWNGASDNKIHPGKLPASINGLPFDVNQDGLLTPDEPFTLTVKVFAPGPGIADQVQMLFNGIDPFETDVATTGGALSSTAGNISGHNSVILFKNRVASANTVTSDGLFDDLDVSPVANNTVTTAWNADADGNWITDSNWTSNSPYAIDSQVTFGNVITSPRTVTLTAGEVAGTLNFSSSVSYTVASTATGTISPNITLASTTGTTGINVTAGTHTITGPMTLKGDSTISIASGSGLAINGIVTAGNLTKSGTGSVQLGAIRANTFVLAAGAASITSKTTANTAAGVSVVGSISIASGLKLDLANNSLVYNYANGGVADPTKSTFIRNLIASGYNGGAWTGTNGLTSSNAAAVAANSTAAFKTGLGYAEATAIGLTANSSTFDANIYADQDMVVVRYAYYGDANLNGTVNTADFTLLAASFNQTGAGWINGDFNYDGTVNALDFNILASNYGATGALPGSALGSLVPEPGSIALLGASLIAMQIRRRRH